MAGLVPSAARLFLTRPRRALLLLRMAGWIAVFSLAVKVFSLPRALRLVSVSPPAGFVAGANEQQALVSAVDALLGLDVLFFRPICWKRAAILHRYLGLNGINTRINFGLRKGPAGPLIGHAWLEADGRPIFETDTPDYAVTYVFPSSAPFAMDLTSIARTKSL
ncbi:MAG: lasso peptide biosynthesis B2 protein [Pyrinomonadaceae bacterium]